MHSSYLREILLRGKYLQWFGVNYFEVNGDDCNEIGVKYSKENTVLFKELRNHPVPLKYAWNGRTPHIRTNLDYQRAQCFLSVESFLRHSLLSSYTCCFGKKFEHSLQSYLNLNFLFGLDRRCFSTTFASGKLIWPTISIQLWKHDFSILFDTLEHVQLMFTTEHS